MSWLIALLLTPLAVVTGYFCLEVIVGLFPAQEPILPANVSSARVVLIVPANNEATIIGGTLPEMKEAAQGQARLMVVADNCTDSTATIARDLGVDVVRRDDPHRRGKGFALAFARDALAKDPPDVVVVLDADCSIDRDSLAALIQSVQRNAGPCQAINLLRACRLGPAIVQISTFAFMLKNLVRQRGLGRLTGCVHLTGTGMALPWAHFADAELATASIVEDVRLGLDLAESGIRSTLVENATVWSSPSDVAGTLIQRQRWEGGYLSLVATRAPRALVRSIGKGDLPALMAAIDLFIPPLALLFMLNAAGLTLAVIAALMGFTGWGLVLGQGAITGLSILIVLIAWWAEGRQYLTASALLRTPLYVGLKLPIYLRQLVGRKSTIWGRAKR